MGSRFSTLLYLPLKLVIIFPKRAHRSHWSKSSNFSRNCLKQAKRDHSSPRSMFCTSPKVGEISKKGPKVHFLLLDRKWPKISKNKVPSQWGDGVCCKKNVNEYCHQFRRFPTFTKSCPNFRKIIKKRSRVI